MKKNDLAEPIAAPAVTIITVVFNSAALLEQTILSVVKQTYDNIEYIIIDGGSTDGTLDVIKKYEDFVDYWLSESDCGIYYAMNKGIDHCRGDSWVIFLNAGDCFYDEQVIERMRDLFDDSADFVIGDTLLNLPDKERFIPCNLNRRNEMPACHQSLLTKGWLLKKMKFDPRFRVGADFNLFARATDGFRKKNIIVYQGIIAKIAPEGFSAKHEGVLQHDYFTTLSLYAGNINAWEWLFLRKLRRIRNFILSIFRTS